MYYLFNFLLPEAIIKKMRVRIFNFFFKFWRIVILPIIDSTAFHSKHKLGQFLATSRKKIFVAVAEA